MFDVRKDLPQSPLYDTSFEHDACGIGCCVNIKGKKSHETVNHALTIVEHLEHRAGKDAEGKTGDGVGILTQIPHKFFKKVCSGLGINIGGEREYGVGMFFFPQNEFAENRAKKMFETIAQKEGLRFLGWRKVDICPQVLGHKALSCMPDIWQAFIEKPKNVAKGLDFDRRLYVVRRLFEQSSETTYVLSLSSRTIVYKGMFLVGQLRTFFKDLQDEDFESAITIVHSRFSTNTNPSWERAHPYRFIVHNGEINTIKGNADKMQAREENMASPYLEDQMAKVLPVIKEGGSDSAMLDNTLEFLVMSGMPLPLAVMITIPEPWDNNSAMSQRRKDFYQYYATMMEPWDGPASIIFTDGDMMGAVLDRNGLRPSRYLITDDDTLILSSEVGVLPIPPEKIVVKERLHPGKMLLVDTLEGRVIDDEELKKHYAGAQPYGEWIDSHMVSLKDLRIPNQRVPRYGEDMLQKMQKAFGYTYEEVKTSILPMALTGNEPIDAMGVDTPLPVLAKTYHPLFDYFKQLFAQVTNPPIDAIREKIVTSTTVYLGKSGNLLEEKPENCEMLKVDNPILTDTDLMKIRNMKRPGFKVEVIPMTYYKNTSLEKAIERMYIDVDRAFRENANILILSDRGVDETHVAIPSLLAVAAVNHHLVVTKKRTSVSLVLESAEPREVHHFAALLGFGATAVNPYLAQETVWELVEKHMLDKDPYAAVDDYDRAVRDGIVKIASKMGISTIQSYSGSKIFEAIGIDKNVINTYFPGVVCRVGGITLKDIERSVDDLHSAVFDPLEVETDETLNSPGHHQMRSGGDDHLYNPATIHALQMATRNGDYKMFKTYSDLVEDEDSVKTLRGLMDFNYAKKPVPIEEVEPASEIVKRFKTGAMSFGAISEEAHETMAIAMNHLHGKSNTGEGGEDSSRFHIGKDGIDRNSAIKQVASGRFGVTSEYLMSAKEIQIKMAQGAKPGEGGHLPGAKVYPWVAKVRHSTPGVSLISPPPHHDIYSIEDLAQLIYDLKNANRAADINVKLVSEAGVGTVAAGVAKAGAQVILISGYDGGSGAAPRSSIHNAGLPWELGLAETHQTLIQNGLRSRVRLETDGKLMTGRDVAIAAILGAEEFGFATAVLVSMGCVMMRVCNKDTCPMGVATQNPELRKRFCGKPEYIENFMLFVAEELREYMSKLGVRTVDELVGRSDLLKVRDNLPEQWQKVDLSAILNNPYDARKMSVTFDPKKVYDFKLENTLDEKVLLKKLGHALEKGEKASLSLSVSNTDRAFGTIFGSEITKRYGNTLPGDTFHIRCEGAGGQSFGAFIPKGLTLELEGDSNDYFGKGLSGGELVVYPPKSSRFRQDTNIVIGNVALYGATSGSAYICGTAGERFCVRNSGANAVVEGCGDHGCEYMTGGKALILGSVGKNFAAGMSGGVAYVLDEDNDLYTKINKTMVSSREITSKYDVMDMKEMLEEHVRVTGSVKGKEILEHFEDYLPKFKKIIPHDYEQMLGLIAKAEERGLSPEQAQSEAFYMKQSQSA